MTRGFDDFLKHTGSQSSSGYLKNWHDDGMVDVWLTPAGGWDVRWPHGFFQLGKKRDKKGNEYDGVRWMRWNCHEKETILKKQRKRDDSDRRLVPPAVCPFDMAIELVRSMIVAGRISPTQPLFKFETDQEDEVILAGAWTGAFGKDDDDMFRILKVSDREAQSKLMKQLRSAQVDRTETFKTSGFPKMEYLFRVVQVASPDDGYLVANVPDALGSKVRKGINDRVIQTKGKYNPARDPLAMRWVYNEHEEYSKKYDVVVLTEEVVTPELEDAFAMEPPNIDEDVAPGSIALLRSLFEKHCLIDMPWDDVFGPAERAGLGGNRSATPEPWDKAREAAQSPRSSANDEPPAPASDAGDDDAEPADGFECDCCDQILTPKDLKCPKCGAEYDPITGKLTYDPRKAPAPAQAAQGAPAAAADGPPAARKPKAR